MERANLDVTVNDIGYKIAELYMSNDKRNDKIKKAVENALGVLAHDGVYAFYVFCNQEKLDENKKADNKNIIIEAIEPLMAFTDTKLKDNNYEEYFKNLSGNLHDLLFFKDMLEKALIYARYHIKARGD